MLVFIMAAGERVGGHQTAQFVVKRVELNSRDASLHHVSMCC